MDKLTTRGVQGMLRGFREVERCTVHASADCLDPDGPTYSGTGWDHNGTDQRIECANCANLIAS